MDLQLELGEKRQFGRVWQKSSLHKYTEVFLHHLVNLMVICCKYSTLSIKFFLNILSVNLICDLSLNLFKYSLLVEINYNGGHEYNLFGQSWELCTLSALLLLTLCLVMDVFTASLKVLAPETAQRISKGSRRGKAL